MAPSGNSRTASTPNSRSTPATSPGRAPSKSPGRSTTSSNPSRASNFTSPPAISTATPCSTTAPSKILFCGDALKFELDPADPRRATTISAHKAFVRGIPLTPNELRKYRDVFARLDFTQTWTPFEQARNSGRPEALALIDSMLATRPHAYPVPLADLSPAATRADNRFSGGDSGHTYRSE